MSSLQSSWQRTEQLLVEAKALLLPAISANDAGLLQFEELIDANELGLAFEWLESIAYEALPTCLPLLRLLRSAADQMGLGESSRELDNRIHILEKSVRQ